ncbi:MAG: sigma-70 family RNA polymerase sigma factor [Planctomycetaceae bacterium]|nr:sigma-70 family RNA polymerase sigma factor [Planctomycetaceae bacterium]
MPLDVAELAKLIESQAASLRLWVRSRCASCEDVVQEAFCRLAAAEPPPDNPVAWLYRVCRNLAGKQRLSDKRRRERERARAQSEVATSDRADRIEIEETIAAVEELDDELREVLVARVWGQLSLEEVAELCGVSTATAFRRYEAALKALRSKVESKCGSRR